MPNIITVEVDTNTRKIVRIDKQDRNSKIEPGEINIDNWTIDSNKAIDIALKLVDKDIADYTLVYLSGTKLFSDGNETWDVNLFNENTKKSAHVEIDAYTGEVYKCEVK